MRPATLFLLAMLLLGAPALSQADPMNESQNPDEYTQEDSHPLKFASFFVTPIGFLLEWTVARPLHYISTTRFIGPVLNSEYGDAETAPVAEQLPAPDFLPSSEAAGKPAPLHEESLNAPPARASLPSAGTQSSAPPPAESPGQPVLH